MRHPTPGIFGKGRAPDSVPVAIHRALARGERCKREQQRAADDRLQQGSPLFETSKGLGQPGGRKRQRTKACEILVMIRDERITKGSDHDESQHWAESRRKKKRGNL